MAATASNVTSACSSYSMTSPRSLHSKNRGFFERSVCTLGRDKFLVQESRRKKRHVFFDENLGRVYEASDASMCEVQYNKAVKPPLRNLTVAIGTNVVLPCELTSNLAQLVWTFNGRELSQEANESMLYDITLQALVILGVGVHHSGTYYCFSVEQETRFASEIYQLSVVASPSLTLESRAPMDGLGLVWMMVIALGAVCLVLFLAVIYLRRKLQDEMEKGSKSLENSLLYPIQLPSQPKITKCLPCQAQIQMRKTLGSILFLLFRWFA